MITLTQVDGSPIKVNGRYIVSYCRNSGCPNPNFTRITMLNGDTYVVREYVNEVEDLLEAVE